MKAFLIWILLLAQAGFSPAQTTISGVVKSITGDTLAGVNVYIKGTLDGGTSGARGNFLFTTTASGNQLLVASMVGMETFLAELQLAGVPINRNIILHETINELNAVVISAGNFETGNVKKAAVLTSLDIVTTAGATADIFGALQTLPGTMPVMEESGLFVRGGDAGESKTFFDGILVNKAFGSDLPDISQRGRFSPFLFKGTSFSTGAYSSQNGGALSSTMEMESKDIAPKTKSEIGIMSVGVNANHAQRFKSSSLEMNGSYYNLKPIFKLVQQNTRWTKEPESWEGSAFYKMKTGNNGMLKIYSSYERSHIGLISYNRDDVSEEDKYTIKSKNLYLNSTWSQYFGKHWKIYAGAGYGDDLNKINIDAHNVSLQDRSFHGKVMATRYFGKLSDIKAGVDYFQFNILESYDELGHALTNALLAGFVESNIYLGNALILRPGWRYEISQLTGRNNVAPRLSVAFQLNQRSQLSAGYGLYYQLPGNDYLFASDKLDFENAAHYVVNYQYQHEKRTIRAEVYLKNYNHLVKEIPAVNNSGNGYSRGLDLFFRDTKTVRHADFWITYSLLDTKRNYRNYPIAATPSFVAAHVVNIVGKYFIRKWSTSVGATYTTASGRTYYNPNNPEFLGDKTKPYHNFSMNISYLTHIGNRFTIIYLSTENIFGIKNVFGYRYSADGAFRKPIIPSAPRSIFLGIFITFGDDNPLNI